MYYDPLIVLCAEGELHLDCNFQLGLLETEHPYTLMSRFGFRDLLASEVYLLSTF